MTTYSKIVLKAPMEKQRVLNVLVLVINKSPKRAMTPRCGVLSQAFELLGGLSLIGLK